LEELQDEGTPAKVKAWVAAHPAWLEVWTVAVLLDASLAVLDVGEREAICLAQELAADALIMDEPAGRDAAKRGTVSVRPKRFLAWLLLGVNTPGCTLQYSSHVVADYDS
jgi:predicted nucleic acid-binding protein